MPKPEDQVQAEKNWESISEKAAFLGPSLAGSGELTGAEDLVVKGAFRGSINLPNHTLLIDAGARLEADITAGHVFLRGNLVGKIRATGRVVVSSGAQMNGDIAAARISIQDGAQFKGSIRMAKGGG